MATIVENETSMTLYFSKRTGEIKCYSTGIQSMNFFGTDTEDYSIIWDYVVLPMDNFVLSNTSQFRVDTATKELKLINTDLSKYI